MKEENHVRGDCQANGRYVHAFRWISEASIAPAVVLLIERTCVAGCLRRIDTHVQLCINYWYAVPDNRADIDAIINNFLQGSDTTLPCVCTWLVLAKYWQLFRSNKILFYLLLNYWIFADCVKFKRCIIGIYNYFNTCTFFFQLSRKEAIIIILWIIIAVLFSFIGSVSFRLGVLVL